MKYAMVKHYDFRFPIVFPDMLSHSQFENVGKITSAGFVSHTGEPYGTATSLKGLKPAKGDAAILAAFLTGQEAILHMVQYDDAPGGPVDAILQKIFEAEAAQAKV